MPWIQGYPYYLLMGSVLSFYMGISSYRHRKSAGRRYLWILMLLVSLIFIATAGEIMSSSFQAKLWWKNMQQAPLFLSALFTYAVVKVVAVFFTSLVEDHAYRLYGLHLSTRNYSGLFVFIH